MVCILTLFAMHVVNYEQFLPISLGEAWDFFSTPLNLNRITPDKLHFEIVGELPARMYEGQILQYRLRLPMGLRVSWFTRIATVSEPHFFIDEQLQGPYRIWHHQHSFEQVEGGVLMRDVVHYKVSFWPLGPIVNALYVKRQIKQIFNWRKQALQRIFPL